MNNRVPVGLTEETRSGRIWTRATAKRRAGIGSVAGNRSAEETTASGTLSLCVCGDSLQHPTVLTFTRKDARKYCWVGDSPRLLCAGTAGA